MANPMPLSRLPGVGLLDSVLPDFVLAFAFFTALVYAVLGRRFGQRRPAVVMAVTIGLALAVGLTAWEHAHGWSIRDLGPVAVGFALIVLAGVMFQAIRGVGGTWAGAGLAIGASLLVGTLLGIDWPVDGGALAVAAIAALIAGVLAFRGHHARPAFRPPRAARECGQARHDLGDLYGDRQAAQRLRDRLWGVRREAQWLGRRPDLASDIDHQLRQLLPAEGSLTQRLARLRAHARQIRRGHAHRVDDLRSVIDKLPPQTQRGIAKEIQQRYAQLKLDARLERLDRSVTEVERRVRALTREARSRLEAYDYRSVPGLLDQASRLQDHNLRLIQVIERTEARLLTIARQVTKDAQGSG